ncbi:MAG: hypothetical protein K9J37_23640 [Saprospiraceae bacterium]|nr:hypothetical protein [Saprospiraceae bacterium]MCF8252920.1 hypothetical protein [Saprospiraceae bacterium]MCF8281583.1 hypothetical protein [Bacteroidales bacterium]MCF8314462.1 hypothetical protein [Saprospiraceae bacterium]MCF8443349.1 hypothetical protein [Saprospiraceae bacterium]
MTMNRDNRLTSLRPDITANIEENPENSPGHFQNATLRPILKVQNELLLQIFKHYLQKSKGSFFQLPAPKQLEFIGNSIRSDLRFRNMLTGTIIGHFTEQEWEVFAPQEQEITRRIADMLIKRFSDQIDTLLA